jgi:hypothetical protein
MIIEPSLIILFHASRQMDRAHLTHSFAQTNLRLDNLCFDIRVYTVLKYTVFHNSLRDFGGL